MLLSALHQHADLFLLAHQVLRSIDTLQLNDNLFDQLPDLYVIRDTLHVLELIGNKIRYISQKRLWLLVNLAVLKIFRNCITQMPEPGTLTLTVHLSNFPISLACMNRWMNADGGPSVVVLYDQMAFHCPTDPWLNIYINNNAQSDYECPGKIFITLFLNILTQMYYNYLIITLCILQKAIN